jgi:glycosyl transferase family 25
MPNVTRNKQKERKERNSLRKSGSQNGESPSLMIDERIKEAEDCSIALPPVWVVNLARSPERRRFMQQQFASLDLSYRIINASDGQNLSREELQKYSKRQALKVKGRELMKGEIGCALTHAKIYQQMLVENLEEVLILEDDIVITRDLLHVLMERKKFPPEWEAVNFANTWAQAIPLGGPVCKDYRVCRFKGIANRTSAYLINRQGAKKLIEHLYPIRLPADDFVGITQITGLQLYGITPSVVALAHFKSDIWSDEGEATEVTFNDRTMWARIRKKGKMMWGRLRG